MPRPIWKGAISFGLVNVPVELMGAQEQPKLRFHMLDSQDYSPIGYKKVSKSTGKEVQPKRIVKGYEYERGQYVIIKEEDFKRANPVATQTIDIEDFVDLEDVDILMFEKPYYLVPTKAGRKGYVLLRKVLEQTRKAAVARFVMHQKEHLVMVLARGPYLILETLRFANEVREIDEAEYLDEVELSKIKLSTKEVQMAESLVNEMTSKWNPSKYKDTYQDELLKFIKQKIKNNDVTEAPEVADTETKSEKTVVDLMPLLRKSLEASRTHAKRGRRQTEPSTSPKNQRRRRAE